MIVRDNPAESRYEIHEDDRLAGFAAYRLNAGRITFTHTETEPEFGGRGFGKQLVTAALDDVRTRGLDVVPLCPFVRSVISKDPDRWLGLVPEQERRRLNVG